MAKFSLRKAEDQAKVSAIFSGASVFPLLAMAGAIVLKFNWFEKTIFYGPKVKIGVLLCTLLALGLSAVGFYFGLTSAGQRRNDKQQLSWAGFFLGALVLSLTMVMFIVFRMRGEELNR